MARVTRAHACTQVKYIPRSLYHLNQVSVVSRFPVTLFSLWYIGQSLIGMRTPNNSSTQGPLNYGQIQLKVDEGSLEIGLLELRREWPACHAAHLKSLPCDFVIVIDPFKSLIKGQ